MLISLNDVRRAIESETVAPFFQPIYRVGTGDLVGFEVLARCQHPVHGWVLPENFIPLAEEHGLIGHLTDQILCKSFLAASVMPNSLFLAVNISPAQLDYLSLPREIQEIAEQYGFPLSQLTVEITESALINNLDHARKTAVALRELGCELALDDFGTGYSSLLHLHALPFSKLKIDRSFVQSMTRERQSRKLVAAVIGLGYSMGMSTVAEGVETHEQGSWLLELGCDLAQGWLYGRPLPAEYLPKMIGAARMPLASGSSAHQSGFGSFGLDALPAQRLAQLQAIYDGVPVGLGFLDRNLRYMSLNQRLADLNGASVTDHLGRTVGEMIPGYFPVIEPFLQRTLNGEVIKNIGMQRPATWPGDTDRKVLLSYQPVLDEMTDIIGILVAVVDVTES